MSVTTQTQTAREDFAAIVGESRVAADENVRDSFAVDGKVPRLVVYCSSAEETAQTLKAAAAHGLCVIACRYGTKLGIGNIPARYDVALSLKEMTRVWHYEPSDLTITVEAGMKLADFQHFVGRDGLWLPLDPPAAARASIGGILSANSSGPLRLAFGAPRDMTLGMKIATADGKIVKTGGRVVKNVAGYDLAKLMIGSFGTLGVIVEANFKLYPLPVGRATFVFEGLTLDRVREIRKAVLDSPLTPMRLVCLNEAAAQKVDDGSKAVRGMKGAQVWAEVGGSKRVIDRASQILEATARATESTLTRCDDTELETLWTRITESGSTLADSSPNALALKASLPVANCEHFLARMQREGETAKVRISAVGQLGVGIVRLHLLDDLQEAALAGLVESLRAAALELGGSLIVERCSPSLKTRLDVWGRPGNDLRMMRKLKETWDPKGVLSPGRFLAGI